MVCGDKYREQLKTANGHTPAKPWSWFATYDDYDDWYDVVHDIRSDVLSRWNYLLSIEARKASEPPSPEGPQGPYPERDQVLFLLQEFMAGAEKISHGVIKPFTNLTWDSNPLGALLWETSVREAVGIAEKGTCLLERLDDAATYYEEPTLPAPPPPAEGTKAQQEEEEEEEGQSSLGSVLLTLGLLGGGAYLIVRKKRKS